MYPFGCEMVVTDGWERLVWCKIIKIEEAHCCRHCRVTQPIIDAAMW